MRVKKRRMRRTLIVLHRYAGLVLGALISVVGITGSLLVFDHALDEKLAPQTVPAPFVHGQRASLQAVLDNASAALPGELAPTRLHLARRPGSSHMVRFSADDGRRIEVSVAPADARVLAVRTWGEYPMSWLYNFHFTLLAGEAGKITVGVCGLLLMFFCISGVIIWWPRRGQWRRALTIRRDTGSVRFNFDLHKAAGIYLLPLLLLASFSGVSLVFHNPVEKLVGAVLPLDKRPGPRSGPAERKALTVDEVVAAASTVFPGAELKRVYLPPGPEGSWQLAFNQPGEPWTHHAASAVWVDRYSGEVLASWNALEIASGSKFLTWQFPLHNGDALGLPGRWLVFTGGWMPALLFGTGLYVWWRKRVRRPASKRAGRRPGYEHCY